MVLHLFICDIVLAFFAVVFLELDYGSFRPEDEMTSFESFAYYTLSTLIAFGGAGTMIWTCCFAHCLYSVGKEGTEYFLQFQVNTYIKISYLVGIITAIIYPILYSLCMSNPAEYKTLLTIYFMADLVLSGICFIISSVYYTKGIKLAFSQRRQILWSLIIYPVILLVCNIPERIYLFFDQFDNVYVEESSNPSDLRIFINSIWLLQGMLNSLVYGLTKGVHEGIREKCRGKSDKNTLLEVQTEEVLETHTKEINLITTREYDAY